MIGATTYTISSGELDLALVIELVLSIVAGVSVYRSSERIRFATGSTPWHIPSWLWVVIVVLPPLFPWTLLVYLLARATTRPRHPSGGTGPGHGYGGPWYGHPGYGPPGYPGGPGGPWPGPGQAPPPGGQAPPYPGTPPYPGGPTPPPYPGAPPYPGGPTPPPYPGGPPGAPWAVPGQGTAGTEVAPWPPTTDPSGLPLPPNLGEGWYVDPTERFFLRYWDGRRWTDRVASGGKESTDPVVQGGQVG